MKSIHCKYNGIRERFNSTTGTYVFRGPVIDYPLLFEWDEANLAHIAQHDVTREEAEQVFVRDVLDMEMQFAGAGSGEERLLQLGETAKGRILQLVTTWRGGRVRVISAWDAPKQLKSYYLAEMRRLYGDSEDSEV